MAMRKSVDKPVYPVAGARANFMKTALWDGHAAERIVEHLEGLL